MLRHIIYFLALTPDDDFNHTSFAATLRHGVCCVLDRHEGSSRMPQRRAKMRGKK
jgi:hypothetical protein